MGAHPRLAKALYHSIPGYVPVILKPFMADSDSEQKTVTSRLSGLMRDCASVARSILHLTISHLLHQNNQVGWGQRGGDVRLSQPITSVSYMYCCSLDALVNASRLPFPAKALFRSAVRRDIVETATNHKQIVARMQMNNQSLAG